MITNEELLEKAGVLSNAAATVVSSDVFSISEYVKRLKKAMDAYDNLIIAATEERIKNDNT